MSVHSSLSGGKQSVRHRNVLKRYERIQRLQEKSVWPDERSAFGLPKVRSIKYKVKKTAKDKPAEAGAAPAEGAATTAAATTATAGKPGAPAKGKEGEKGAKK